MWWQENTLPAENWGICVFAMLSVLFCVSADGKVSRQVIHFHRHTGRLAPAATGPAGAGVLGAEAKPPLLRLPEPPLHSGRTRWLTHSTHPAPRGSRSGDSGREPTPAQTPAGGATGSPSQSPPDAGPGPDQLLPPSVPFLPELWPVHVGCEEGRGSTPLQADDSTRLWLTLNNHHGPAS